MARPKTRWRWQPLALIVSLGGCGEQATLPPHASVGPNPRLPLPEQTLIPTVLIATAKGWPEGAKPTPAAGLSVAAFATGLDHPRWLYVLPNGDVLVAEGNAPAKVKPDNSLRGKLMASLMKRAGAGVPSAGGHPAGTPEDVRTGFLDDKGDARGRPVGVAVDKAGAVRVADDVGNAVWRVTPAAPGAQAR